MTTPISKVNMAVDQLIATMRGFRKRLLSLVVDLDDRQMIGPRLAIVNPPLWEIGHVAWFQEFWALRHLRGAKPVMVNADQLYNSSDVAHDTRWELLLPDRPRTLAYMEEIMDRAVEQIDGKSELSAEEYYFYLLTAYHEGMHAEALAYTRQTLGYPAPDIQVELATVGGGAFPGDVEIPGGKYLIGATTDFPFAFDNEKWAHEVILETFRIARAPVTNGQFLAFVEDGGYRTRRFWSAEGWHWLETGGSPQLEKSFAKFFNKTLNEPIEISAFNKRLDHPVYWKREASGRWLQRI
jgi:iron(II)-dependent oxidoreductase